VRLLLEPWAWRWGGVKPCCLRSPRPRGGSKQPAACMQRHNTKQQQRLRAAAPRADVRGPHAAPTRGSAAAAQLRRTGAPPRPKPRALYPSNVRE
jgi:hypothetical protein